MSLSKNRIPVNPKEKEKEEEMKKLRANMKKELDKKSLEVAELKDMILKLKVEKSTTDGKAQAILNMHSLRKEMKIADNFIKEVMKDNMMSYEIIKDMVKEEEKIPLKKDNILTRSEKYKLFRDDMLTKMNYNNCRCSTCTMNKSMSYGLHKSEMKDFVHNFNLTDKLFMGIHYNSLSTNMVVKNKEDKTKEIILRDNSTRDIKAHLKIYWRNEDSLVLQDIKFNDHMDCCQLVKIMDDYVKVSISSMLVVMAMREVTMDPVLEMEKNQLLIKENRGFCFIKMYCELMEASPMNSLACSMEDLTEHEEMALLTHYGDRDIYMMLKKGEPRDEDNHISTKDFEGGLKTKLYMMSTPMMRKMCFFSDPEEDYEVVQVEEDNIKKMEVNKGKERVEKFIAQSGGIDEIIKREDSKVDPNVDLTTEDLKELMNRLRLRTKSISTEESNMQEDTILEKYDLMISNKMFSGSLVGDFYLNIYKRRNSDKGFDNNKVTDSLESLLSPLFLEKSDLNIKYLMMANMSFDMFLACLYFMSDLKLMVERVYMSDLHKWQEYQTKSKKMFQERVYWELETKLDSIKMNRMWNQFLQSLKQSYLFKHRIFKRMFIDFKKRVIQFIFMTTYCKEISGNLNSFHVTKSEVEKAKLNAYEKKFMEDHQMIEDKMMTSIDTFQPTRGLMFIKMEENALEMDFLETNEIVKEVEGRLVDSSLENCFGLKSK